MLNRILSRLRRELRPFLTAHKAARFSRLMEQAVPDRYKTIIVFESRFGWDTLLRQRPQQIASHFPGDVLFLYHSNRDPYPDADGFRRIKEGVYLVNLDLYRKRLWRYLEHHPDKYVMTYSTDATPVSLMQRYQQAGFRVIYEYVDTIDADLTGEKRAKILAEKRDSLLSDQRVLAVCTATRLLDSLKGRPHTALITNGCDYGHFAGVPVRPISSGCVTVGYYGVLASWVDYPLLRKIAEDPRYRVVLIGNVYDGSLKESGILELPNVDFRGKVEYDELPKEASCFDICIIPFRINEITLATSPVKLFEYLAMGKPVVSTALPECQKYPCVFTARDHDEFLAGLAQAEQAVKRPEFVEQLRITAYENSWQSKCEELLRFIKGKV